MGELLKLKLHLKKPSIHGDDRLWDSRVSGAEGGVILLPHNPQLVGSEGRGQPSRSRAQASASLTSFPVMKPHLGRGLRSEAPGSGEAWEV